MNEPIMQSREAFAEAIVRAALMRVREKLTAAVGTSKIEWPKLVTDAFIHEIRQAALQGYDVGAYYTLNQTKETSDGVHSMRATPGEAGAGSEGREGGGGGEDGSRGGGADGEVGGDRQPGASVALELV